MITELCSGLLAVQRYSVNVISLFQEIEVWYMMSLLNANAADTLPAYQVKKKRKKGFSYVSQTREFFFFFLNHQA